MNPARNDTRGRENAAAREFGGAAM